MHGYARLLVVVVASVFFGPAAAFAQATIAGVDRDTSGAVLPGVTADRVLCRRH